MKRNRIDERQRNYELAAKQYEEDFLAEDRKQVHKRMPEALNMQAIPMLKPYTDHKGEIIVPKRNELVIENGPVRLSAAGKPIQ